MARIVFDRKAFKAKSIGAEIAKWMLLAGVKQSDIADLLNLKQQAVSYKLRKGAFTYADLIALFEFLNVPDDEILRLMKVGK